MTTKRQQAIDAAAEEAFRTEAVSGEEAPVTEATRRGKFVHGGMRFRRQGSAFDQTKHPQYVDPQVKAQQEKELEENKRIAEELASFSARFKTKYNLTDDLNPDTPITTVVV